MLAVAGTIARHMTEPKVVLDKSTVPVGTADKGKAHMAAVLAERGQAMHFDVVSNPEVLKEGAAVNDCMRPDRIVIGTDNEQVKELVRELYAPVITSYSIHYTKLYDTGGVLVSRSRLSPVPRRLVIAPMVSWPIMRRLWCHNQLCRTSHSQRQLPAPVQLIRNNFV